MHELTTRAILYIRRFGDGQHESMRDQIRWAIETAKREGLDLKVSEEMLHDALTRGVTVAGDLYLDDSIAEADLNRLGLIEALRGLREDGQVGAFLIGTHRRVSSSAPAEHEAGNADDGNNGGGACLS